MNKRLEVRIDEEIFEMLEYLKKELKITRSDIIRMAITHFAKYVEKVNK